MFGDVLKQLRIESRLTQKELGGILGISESTVGMYERNKREPDFETLESIADYFNVDMDYLTGRSDIRRAISFSPNAVIDSKDNFSPVKAKILNELADMDAEELALLLRNIDKIKAARMDD